MTRTLKDYFSKSPQKTAVVQNGESNQNGDTVILSDSPVTSEPASESSRKIPCFSSLVNGKQVAKLSASCDLKDPSEPVDIQMRKPSKRALIKIPEDGKKRKYVFSSSSSESEGESIQKKGKLKQRSKRNKKEPKSSSQESPSEEQKSSVSNSILKYFSGPSKTSTVPSAEKPLKIDKTDCCDISMSKKDKKKVHHPETESEVVNRSVRDPVDVNCGSSEPLDAKVRCTEESLVCKKKPKWSMRLKFGGCEVENLDQKGTPPDLVDKGDIDGTTADAGSEKGDESEEKTNSQESGRVDGQCSEESDSLSDVEIKVSETEMVDLVEDNEQSQSPKLRRSSRVRKPVTKFVIESDSDTERKASKQRKKKVNGRGSPTVQLDSETSSDEEVKKKPAKKLAPIFVRQKKHVPTPEELAKEAAKQAFLSSGVPDEVKQHQELIERLENIEYQYVPAVSHVQQLDSVDLSWISPTSQLPFCLRTASKQLPDPGPRSGYYRSFLHKRYSTLMRRKAFKLGDVTWSSMKKTVREFQKHAEFPFYQMMYRLSKKCVKDDLPWAEKYRPQNLSDIAFNRGPVEALLDWGKELRTVAKRRKEGDSSDSDESDGDEVHGAVLLSGCCGSGKTTGAYAVAEQLGWDFVEVNASSKRSGKHLQLALQEATQSHQMSSEGSAERTCAVLIEDVDLVFSDDEDGYYSTLVSLIASSKRPVVMTTTSNNLDAVLTSLKKRISHIEFTRPSLPDAACFLACVSLLEGAYVPYDVCLSLAEKHGGDLRSMLSFAQVWLQSFPLSSLKADCQSKLSQRRKKEKQHSKKIESSSESEGETEDIRSELGVICEMQDKEELEWDYCKAVGIPVSEEFKKILEPLKDQSDTKWWQRLNFEDKPKTVNSPEKPKRPSKVELGALNSVESYLEHESTFDFGCYSEKNTLLKPWWKCEVSDGIGDEPVPFRDFQDQFECDPVLYEIANYGRKLCVSECRKESKKCQHVCSLGTTDGSYFSALTSQRDVDESLFKQLDLTSGLQRDAVAMDYLSYVRAIYKIESARYEGNTKRGGRFHHYAKSLGLALPAESVLCLANSLR